MTVVSRSLSEIRATVTAALRGAGCDWGLAEEAGVAARILESHGLPAVRVLARLLDGEPDFAARRVHGALCGVSAMAAFADRMPFVDDAIPAEPVAAPLMLAAPLIRVAREQGAGHTLRWDDAVLHCVPQGVVARGALDCVVGTSITLHMADHVTATPIQPDWRSRRLAKSDWDILERYAARTRVAGTGAANPTKGPHR